MNKPCYEYNYLWRFVLNNFSSYNVYKWKLAFVKKSSCIINVDFIYKTYYAASCELLLFFDI